MYFFIIEITIIKYHQKITEHIFNKTLAIVYYLRYYCDKKYRTNVCMGRDKKWIGKTIKTKSSMSFKK